MSKQPVFDMQVPDWDYLAFIVSKSECESGYLHTLTLIYKDGKYKAKTRLRFPLGGGLVGELEDSSKTKLLKRVEDMIVGTPGTSDHIIVEIWNKGGSKKGNDLLECLLNTPHLQAKLIDLPKEFL